MTENVSLWIKGDLDELSAVINDRIPRIYEKEQIIYSQGDLAEHIYIVRNGRVRITSYAYDSQEKQVFIAEKGAVFGELSALVSTQYECSAVAIVKSQIYVIEKEYFLQSLKSNWNLNYYILTKIAQKGLVFENEIINSSSKQTMNRVAKILLDLCEQYGSPYTYNKTNGVRINIRFSHQDIANLIGTNRVTVSNIFSYLLKENILVKADRFYTVLDVNKLKQLSNYKI